MSEPDQDLVVIGLRIEAALLPGWFDEVKRVAAAHVRRMAVVEKPDEWVVQCELPKDRAAAFRDALQQAWAEFDQG